MTEANLIEVSIGTQIPMHSARYSNRPPKHSISATSAILLTNDYFYFSPGPIKKSTKFWKR